MSFLRMLAERTPTKRAARAERGPGSAVEELMAALRESVEAAKRDRSKRSRKKAAG